MRSVLFCVDSYYQLMIAVNLYINKYKNDNVDIILFNTMNDAEKIYNNLKKTNCFRHVYLANTYLNMTTLNSKKLERLPKYAVYLFSMIDYTTYVKHVLNEKKVEFYDELFFYGYRPLIQSIFNACLKRNKDLVCYRMDDGMGTYGKEWNMPKPKLRIILEKVISFISGFKSIEEKIVGFYVPNAELIKYKVNYEIIDLPDYENPFLIQLLNDIFEYKCTPSLANNKVVYFGIYGDAWETRDLEYLQEILKVVPKDQIIVKVHPRGALHRYEEIGLKTIKQSSIPWELFMINGKYDDSIFIAQESSAIISSRVLFARSGKDIYLYRLNKLKKSLPYIHGDTDTFLQFFKETDNVKNSIFIPETLEELAGLLKMEFPKLSKEGG